MKKNNVTVLIPSLNPDNKLIKYVESLVNIGFKNIIIVNDGSTKKYEYYFNKLKKIKECIVLKHVVNQGKGRALKTGINYYLCNLSNKNIGLITADADGQHTPEDTMKIAKKLLEGKDDLILGVRDFSKSNVPIKSKLGNNITKFLFKIMYGKKVTDTQTGLRGLSNSFLIDAMKFEGEKYDYEMNMLIEPVLLKSKISEVIIDTVYIDENKSSHFDAVKDSYKIYKILFGKWMKKSCKEIISYFLSFMFFIFLTKHKSLLLNNFLIAIISSYIIGFIFYILVIRRKLYFKSVFIIFLYMITSILCVCYFKEICNFNIYVFKFIIDIILISIISNLRKRKKT